MRPIKNLLVVLTHDCELKVRSSVLKLSFSCLPPSSACEVELAKPARHPIPHLQLQTAQDNDEGSLVRLDSMPALPPSSRALLGKTFYPLSGSVSSDGWKD